MTSKDWPSDPGTLASALWGILASSQVHLAELNNRIVSAVEEELAEKDTDLKASATFGRRGRQAAGVWLITHPDGPEAEDRKLVVNHIGLHLPNVTG